MADDKTQSKVEKAVAAALKSERARVKKAVANVAWPEGIAIRSQQEIKRALNAALAAPAD